MFLLNRLTGLLGFAVLAVLILGIATAATVLADNGNIKSEFLMKDNPTFTPGVAPAGEEAHGSGTFELDGEDLDNLKFKYMVRVDDLMPKTWYQASITVRELTDPNAKGPDGLVVVGWHKTNANGSLNFVGKGVLPDPTVLSPKGIASGWRIDQQIRLPGSHGTMGGCVDCILVCSPTTKVKLNAAGDGLVLGTP